MSETISSLLTTQDQLITRRQALEHFEAGVVNRKLGRQWQVVLPGVYCPGHGALTVRQRLRAALLYAGPKAMLSDSAALEIYAVPFVPHDGVVRLLVPATEQPSSRDFVVIRRSARLPDAMLVAGLPTAPLVRALCEFGLRHENERESLAVLAAAVQRGRVTVADLIDEANAGPSRGRPRLFRSIRPIEAGVRSAPEADFRSLIRRSRILPTPIWNGLVELPGGQRFSPDALFEDAALIHETNGRRFHSAEDAGVDAFEDMQRRNDALVAAGFVVLHNSPRRILTEGAAVLREVEQSYQRHTGRGLPRGVRLLRAAA